MPSVGFLATFDGSTALSLAPTELTASACSLEGLREVFFERAGQRAYVLHTGGLELEGANEPLVVRLELAAPLEAPATDYPPRLHARPWQKPGWFRESLAWSADALGEEIEKVKQVSTSDLGIVLHVGTATRTAYFKTSERGLEAPLTAQVAEAHPGLIPKVIAWDGAQNLLLTEDSGSRLSEWVDLTLWQSAVTKLARFQREAKRDALLDIGCPTHSFNDLAQRALSFLKNKRVLEAWGMNSEHIAALQDLLPRITGAHKRVMRLTMPLLPAPGDAHPMNVLTGRHPAGHDTRWFDWSDACVAHPLLDVGWFLAWLIHPGRSGLPLRKHHPDPATLLWRSYLEAASFDEDVALHDVTLLALAHRALIYHERYARWQGTLPGWRPQYVPYLLRPLLKLFL